MKLYPTLDSGPNKYSQDYQFLKDPSIMHIDFFEFGGRAFQAVTVEELLEAGVPQSLIDDHVTKAEEASNRDNIKAKIAKDVGSQQSILGEGSDAAVLSLFVLSSIINVLLEHGSHKIRVSLKATLGEKIVLFAKGLPDKVDRGEVRLTDIEDSVESVVSGTVARLSSVARVFKDEERYKHKDKKPTAAS
jgi:hypothetical protein